MTELKDHKSRAHALLSASSAHRWLNCPSSAVAAEMYENPDTDFTREGTLAHEVAETVASGQVSPDVLLDDWNKTRGADGVDMTMIDCATGYRDYNYSKL